MSQETETINPQALQIEAIPPNTAAESIGQAINVPLETAGEGKTVARQRRRHKPIRISEALRKEGLDEREIAKMLRLIIERQLPHETSEEADDKFMAELLMSCFRYFEDSGARPAGTGKLTKPVKLLHNVPRPRRNKKSKKKKTKGN